MADKSAGIADATRPDICSVPGLLALAAAATIVLAGCQAKTPASSKDGAMSGRSANLVDSDCRSRVRDRLTHVAMDDFDPVVAIAISTAADATDQSNADIVGDYCLLDRNLGRPDKRCFLFLTRTIQPGGEIYVCVAPDGKPTDLHLGE